MFVLRSLPIVFLVLLMQYTCIAGQGDSELRFGMSTVLSGPAQELGIKFRDGVLAAFKEVNDSGGIGGRKLNLIALDDGYEPSRAGPNMRKLIHEDKVLAIIGNVGTPTAVVAKPIAVEAQTPFLFAYTGAGLLRKDPPEKWIVNFRASYAEELSAMVEALVTQGEIAIEDIAFFTQRDAYGDAGYSVGITAMKKRGLRNANTVPHVRYERNTLAVELALADLMTLPKRPKAVIMVGTYAPCAAFIKKARANGFNPHFLNVSFTGSAALANELGVDGDGVVITRVVPDPSSSLPAAVAFRTALKRLNPDAKPGSISFEGYIAARIVILALERNKRPLTREGLLEALEDLGEFDIGLGLALNLSSEKHQASNTIWPSVVRNGVVEPMNWESLRPERASR